MLLRVLSVLVSHLLRLSFDSVWVLFLLGIGLLDGISLRFGCDNFKLPCACCVVCESCRVFAYVCLVMFMLHMRAVRFVHAFFFDMVVLFSALLFVCTASVLSVLLSFLPLFLVCSLFFCFFLLSTCSVLLLLCCSC